MWDRWPGDDLNEKGQYLKRGFMKTSYRFLFIAIFLVCSGSAIFADDSKTDANPSLPAAGLVTMIDFGAHKCIPCKMMAPIIAELQKEYAGRASIIFIDVREQRWQAKRFDIRSIPTQVFYDKEGNEVGRHIGFLDKKSIISIFEQLGVPEEGGR